MLWFPAIILSTWQRINELEDPTFNHNVDTSNFQVRSTTSDEFCFNILRIYFQVVQAFFYIFGVIYLGYLFVLLLKAYTELRSMPFFGEYENGSR